jgi:hypothetical protein
LEETVVLMDRHVAAEEFRQVAEFVVVHFGIAVALVVYLTDDDIGIGLRSIIAGFSFLFGYQPT